MVPRSSRFNWHWIARLFSLLENSRKTFKHYIVSRYNLLFALIFVDWNFCWAIILLFSVFCILLKCAQICTNLTWTWSYWKYYIYLTLGQTFELNSVTPTLCLIDQDFNRKWEYVNWSASFQTKCKSIWTFKTDQEAPNFDLFNSHSTASQQKQQKNESKSTKHESNKIPGLPSDLRLF